MEFSRGHKIKDLKKIKSKNNLKKGTTFEFIPDEELLKEYSYFDKEKIMKDLELRSYSTAGIKINFKCGKINKTFYHEEGIKDYLNKLNNNNLTEAVYLNKSDKEGNNYEIAFNYGNTDEETFESFVNGIKVSGGTHLVGFKMGFSAEMLSYIKDPKNGILNKKTEKIEIKGEDIRSGLYCVINIKHLNPSYKSQTKDELSNPEVNGTMNLLTREAVKEWINSNKSEAKKIAIRIVQFAKGRTEANKIKDKIININNSSAGLSFSNKFADCVSNNPEETELFIAEGKSASGNIKKCRVSKFQAVFPLKGKPLNIYGKKDSTILNNEEFKELIKVIFGSTNIKEISYDRVRYHKILMASDADYDGLHIQSLLTLFFWIKFPRLFDLGYIYVCQPPKYRTTLNGKYYYFKNDNELNSYLLNLAKKSISFVDSSFSLKKFISKMTEFKNRYEVIKRKYSISDDVLNLFIHETDEDVLMKKLKKLRMSINDDNIVGMHDGIYHDFNLYNLNDDVLELLDILPVEGYISYKDSNNNIIKNSTLINCINYINKKLNIKLDYFKGLGEASPEELFDTTINPETRDVLQLHSNDTEYINKIMKDLFGDNTEERKNFIKEILNLAE